MDKLKYIKLENEDGSYSSSIPLAVDSDYVDVNGNTLTDTLANKANVITVSNLSNDLNAQKSRIDNLATLEDGSTTGDAELQDIRIGYNGENFNNAGNAVREQINDLHRENDTINNDLYETNGHNKIKVKKAKIINNNGYDFSYEGDKIKISGQSSTQAQIKIYPDIYSLEAGEYYLCYPHGLQGNNVVSIGIYNTSDNRIFGNIYSNNSSFSILNISEDLTDIAYIKITLGYSEYDINCEGYIGLMSSALTTAKYEPKYIPNFENLEEEIQNINSDIENIQTDIENIQTDMKKGWNNKKILTYGDSQTGMGRWQPFLKQMLDCDDVVVYGFGGFPLTFARRSDRTEGFGLATDYNVNNLLTKIGEINPDYLLIMGGSNDLTYDGVRHEDWDTITIGNNTSEENTTFKGALKYICKKVLNDYPNLEIIIMSPIGGLTQIRGENLQTPIVNALNYTLGDFAIACREIAEYIGVGFIDVFNCGITIYNSATYIDDGVHINSTLGATKVANHIANVLKSKYSNNEI